MNGKLAKHSVWFCCVLVAEAVAIFASGNVASAADRGALPDRSIAYVVTNIDWSVYETKDAKEECPEGLAALGPREQFDLQFPKDGSKRKLIDTQLAREAEIWRPTDAPDPFPFREAGGKIAIGLNLDGKIKSTDFTSPEGVPGVDNQLFRVIGCITNYRFGSSIQVANRNFFSKANFDRILIELTDVDSLMNDDEVTITTYRGRDPLMTNAKNDFQAGATERLDLRWGKDFIHRTKGKIVDGVLTTQPMDLMLPRETYEDGSYESMRDARFELKLAPEKAEGVIGGYVDISDFYYVENRHRSTHHHSYGQQAPASVYKVLRKLADAYPDPRTQENTAISGAYSVKMVQVRILRPLEEVSGIGKAREESQLAVTGPTK